MPSLPSLRSRAGSSGPRLNLALTLDQQRKLREELQAAKLGLPVRNDGGGGGIPFVPDIVEDAVGQIATALINTPGGLWHMGKQIGADARDFTLEGDFTPERTGGLGVEIGKSIYQDFRHPRENIGYLLMDLFGASSAALRTAGRVGRIKRNLGELREPPGGSAPPPLLPPGAPVPRGPEPTPSLPPSPGEAARGVAETVRQTTKERVLGPETGSIPPLLTKFWQERLPGFPQEAFRYETPARVTPEAEQPFVHPRQRSLFSDPGSDLPPIGFNQQMQIPGSEAPWSLFNRETGLPAWPPGVPGQVMRRPDADLDAAIPAVKSDGTPMNLPPSIEALAAQTAGKGQLRPRALPDLDEFGQKIEPKHTPASRLVRIYADRKTKRLEIDEDTALNMRPVQHEGKTHWQLFDDDQPLAPVVRGYKDAKDVLGEAFLARKGGTEDSPLLAKVDDAPAPDPMNALMAAIDEAGAPKERSVRVGQGRFKTKLIPGEGWAVIDSGKKGAQHKVYPFPADASKAAERHAQLEKRIQKLEGKKKRTKGEEEQLVQSRAILEESKKDLDADTAKAAAIAHAERLNKAAALRDRGIAPGSDIYEDFTNERLYRFKNSIPDDEPIPPLADRIREAEEAAAFAAGHPRKAFSRENAEVEKPVKPVGDKPEKPTPREKGLSTRAKGLNPRELGVSQRQLEGYGLDKAQAAEVTRRLAPALRKIWQSAITAGKEKPSRKAVHQALVEHVGDDLAKKITSRMMKVKGGAPITVNEVLRAVRKALPDPGQTFELTRTVKTPVETTVGPKPGFPKGKMDTHGRSHTFVTTKEKWERVKVPLSRNPLVAEAQKVLLRSYEKHPRGVPLLRKSLDKRFEFEQREIGRIAELLEKSGMVTEERLNRDKNRIIKKGASVGEWADSFNQATKIGLLFLKPAYIPANLLGQIAIDLADHAFNPINLAKSWKLTYDITKGKKSPELQRVKRKMDDAMQQGFVDAIAYERGAVRPVSVVYERAADRFSSILDTPFRRAAFFHEARRQGFDTPAKIEKLLDAKKGTAEWDSLIDVSRRANKNIVDYGRMGPKEKQIVRRVVFFYPWMKGATLYGAHFLSEHSVQGTAAIQEGKMAAERAERELGPVPSYLEGVFKVGETDVDGLGKMPRVINPAAASVLGTPGEALNFARALIGGGTREADQPSGVVTPAISAAIAAFTRQDPFTGRDYPATDSTLGIVYNELKKAVAPVRLAENLEKAGKIERGELDPSEVLFPGKASEAIGRFVGGTTPITLNTREAKQRAFAERRTLQSKRQREISKHNDYRALYVDRARSAGLLGPKEGLPDTVKKAFSARAKRYANRAALEVDLDRDLRPVDRLRADLDLLVREKKLQEPQARTILLSLYRMDDDTINRFLRDLGDRFFLTETLSAYRAALKARGVEINVP